MVCSFLQIIIALGLWNIWLLRFRKPTRYRGGSAQNMTEEFAVYGLPVWFMLTIGTLKILLSAVLIAGIWIPPLTRPAALLLAVLMLGAVGMHLKVRDSVLKMVPAAAVLLTLIIIAFCN